MNASQLSWDLDILKDNPILKDENFGISLELKNINYPVRLLRYWFIYNLLRIETTKHAQLLDICEVGVDVGQMLKFMNATNYKNKNELQWKSWDAVDCLIQRSILEKCGYNDLIEVDLENNNLELKKQYDVIIVLHVLEHLYKPEDVMAKLITHLKPGGIVLGGFPSVPNFLVKYRQKIIRSRARKYGHVSVFSPKRVYDMAKINGLNVEFLSGAFFMRKKKFFLENYKWWICFNLYFGKMFPSWIGELYWQLRKPL